jgi:SPP1 family predicted phage head-tail adaptor
MTATIAIGQMDTVLVLKQPTITQNASNGQNVRTFATYQTIFVKRDAAGVDESEIAGKKTPTNQVDFIGRYDATVNPTWRCEVDGITYEITGIQMIGRRQHMRMVCKTLTV